MCIDVLADLSLHRRVNVQMFGNRLSVGVHGRVQGPMVASRWFHITWVGLTTEKELISLEIKNANEIMVVEEWLSVQLTGRALRRV